MPDPARAVVVFVRFYLARKGHLLRLPVDGLRALCFDITLKDVETVERAPQRVRQWTALTREIIDEYYG